MGPHRPMVFDFVRGVCVLFGRSSVSSSFETWEYDGVDWAQVATASAPSFDGNLAYDLNRMRTVHFGDSGETWEYDGLDWTQMNPATSPPGRGCGSNNMVYDLSRQVVVLFGGCPNPDQGETWEYDGIDWQQVTTANRPGFPRQYPAMTYDSSRDRTVLFGGRDFSSGSASLVDDTWEYGFATAAYTVFGAGCAGSAGTPTNSAASLPVVGATLAIDIGNMPSPEFMAIVLGASQVGPFDLTVIGAPNCRGYISLDFVALVGGAVGTASFVAPVPPSPGLIGLQFFSQAFVFDAGVNVLGGVVSDAATATIGI